MTDSEPKLTSQWAIIKQFTAEGGDVYVSISGRLDAGVPEFTFAVRRCSEQRYIPTSELPLASRLLDEAMAYVAEREQAEMACHAERLEKQRKAEDERMEKARAKKKQYLANVEKRREENRKRASRAS